MNEDPLPTKVTIDQGNLIREVIKKLSKENMASLRRISKHGLAEKHDKGRMAQKLCETLIKKHETLKTFPQIHELMQSSQSEDNRCCVCRYFSAARCDKQATNYAWLGRVSKTARVTLKSQNMRFRGHHQGHVPRPTGKKGDKLTLQTWS